jgi:putative toxin-antitoxin system antitoxin component (TIGR02293 family)
MPGDAARDSHHIGSVALDLLRKRPAESREWIEKRLAKSSGDVSGIEIHREVEAGVPGQAITNLQFVLDMSREDFSNVLGRARKTLNELVQRKRLSRADSDFLYRMARAVVRAVSVFGNSDYAVEWLKAPSEALGGVAPLSLVATVEGDEVLHAELGAIEHGLPV